MSIHQHGSLGNFVILIWLSLYPYIWEQNLEVLGSLWNPIA